MPTTPGVLPPPKPMIHQPEETVERNGKGDGHSDNQVQKPNEKEAAKEKEEETNL